MRSYIDLKSKDFKNFRMNREEIKKKNRQITFTLAPSVESAKHFSRPSTHLKLQ